VGSERSVLPLRMSCASTFTSAMSLTDSVEIEQHK
jgi:hypothetical protein